MGTDDSALIELLVTREGDEMTAMLEAYRTLFSADAAEAVRGDTSGAYQKLLLELMKGARDDDNLPIDQEQVKEDATALYRSGEAKMGTDDNVFIDILTKRSKPHLRAVFDQYNKLDDYDIEKSIAREASFNFKRALVAIGWWIGLPLPLYFSADAHSKIPPPPTPTPPSPCDP